MSRCFPFPPPGYSAKISINETLIESIKLQRETEKAKAERKKERRREKKDKRREKKENDKSLNAAVDEKGRDDKCETKKRKRSEEKVRKSGDKKRRREDKSPKQQSEKKIHAEDKSPKQPKLDEEKERGVNTNELLEKSDLTQEHEQPFYSQNTYCLSDSSENSNQRKLQQATTLHENVANAQGKQLIRIRLPSLKNQPVAVSLSTSKDEQPCSTSGRAGSETGDGYDKLLPKNEEKISSDAPSGIKGVISNLKQTAHVVPSSSSSFEKKMKKVEFVSNLNLKQTAHVVPSSSSSSSFEKKMKRVELVYKALVENLGPSLNEEMPDTNDEFDWLFKRSERCCKPVAAAANDNGGGDERSSTMWPRAHYLAEADVYLMPFTIPF